MKNISLILISFIMAVFAFGQQEKTLQDYNQETIETVKKQLKDLYGEMYETYGEPRLVSHLEFYERCTIITLDDAPTNISNINSLDIMDKYNYEKVHENTNPVSFDPSSFNIFKYRINRYDENDLYFQIYDTDKVLKIEK